MEDHSSHTGGWGEEQHDSERQSYAEFGVHVAGILEAAEETAARIETEAEERAAEIVREAEDAAAVLRQEAAGEADLIRSEAEEAAAKVLDDAENHAAASREAAEEMAHGIAAAARKRHQELNDMSAELESRLRLMLDGARDVAVRLEVALGEREDDDEEAESGSLIEALGVDRDGRT